jgi:hypothetical protein
MVGRFSEEETVGAETLGNRSSGQDADEDGTLAVGPTWNSEQPFGLNRRWGDDLRPTQWGRAFADVFDG